MSNLATHTGTRLAISSAIPETLDDNELSGYGTITFTDIGEVVDIAELAKVFAIVANQSVTKEHQDKDKDTFDIGNLPVTVAQDLSDGGQTIVDAALNSKNMRTFKIVSNNGESCYFTAKVIKSAISGISSGSFVMRGIDLSVSPESLFVSQSELANNMSGDYLTFGAEQTYLTFGAEQTYLTFGV